MLAPDSRVVLLDELKPAPGFSFDSAVATTFTLDLTATLIPALAFSSFSFSGRIPDPESALLSIRRTAERLDVFCQAGNIGVPAQAPDLHAFLEPMVHGVHRPNAGLFHPKVWFVKYVDEDGMKPSYRLLVLSRNLTNSASWDVAVRLDSAAATRRTYAANRPLQQFITSLPARCVTPLDAGRAARVQALADESLGIEWEYPSHVREASFHYLDGASRSSVDFAGSRHLVVSPFVNDAGLDRIRATGPIAILSRAEELEKLTPESVQRLDAYIIDTLAAFRDVPDEDPTGVAAPAETESPKGLLTELHAKMYVIEAEDRRSKQARVIIGSANATGPAFENNVEFCVEFAGHRDYFGVDAFLGPDAAFRTLLEPYEPHGGAQPDPKEEERRQLDNALRAISEIQHVVTVGTRAGDQTHPTFSLRVTAERAYRLQPTWSATFELLTKRGAIYHIAPDDPLDQEVVGVETADITPFLVVRITSKSGLEVGAVVVATLIGDPDDRFDVVLARQINTPAKFLRFLYLLLSLGDPALLALLQTTDRAGGGEFSPITGGPGVLELVLRALAAKPAVLNDLDRLIGTLQATERGREILPEGLDELWEQVQEAQRRLAGAE